MSHAMEASTNRREHGHYRLLPLMTVLSFISMYVFMYAMVDRFSNVYLNLNQVYMAGLMTAPMVVIELALMRAMYPSAKVNIVIVAVSLAALLTFFALIRQQAVIGDSQFLRSMIPHHASAILMCGKAPVQDPEIKDLRTRIISGQQSEIDQMKAILSRLKK